MKKIIISTFVLIILSGCAYLGNAHYNELFGPEKTQARIVDANSGDGAEFLQQRLCLVFMDVHRSFFSMDGSVNNAIVPF